MDEPVFSLRRTIAVFLIAAAILALASWQAVDFLKPKLAERYVDRGITYLESQNYDSAAQEFTKAKNSKAPDADYWLNLASQAPTDPKALQEKWEEWHIDSVLRRLQEASGPFATPKEALTKGIELYSTGEAPYAQYAIDQALTLDPNYPEAWHYRYLTYTELAKQNVKYRDMAEVARQKRDSLTSLYLNP
jgi:tetratricopeptide (TPR) repeat protein